MEHAAAACDAVDEQSAMKGELAAQADVAQKKAEFAASVERVRRKSPPPEPTPEVARAGQASSRTAIGAYRPSLFVDNSRTHF
jgi:hypothetical protein